MAQKYVTCTNCGGTGIGMVTMTGSMPCLLCFGKGKIIDAYNAGRALGLVTNGKLALVQGNYTTAKQAFYQAMDECEDGLATFFYGVCLELGMGIEANPNAALAYYKSGNSRGEPNCKAALERIHTSGFWEATDETRHNFCRNLKTLMEMEAVAVQMNNNFFNTTSTLSRLSTSGRTCRGCNGTGHCSMCNDKGGYWNDAGYYVGKDIKTRTSCSSCNGTGQCKVCHGKGSI